MVIFRCDGWLIRVGDVQVWSVGGWRNGKLCPRSRVRIDP